MAVRNRIDPKGRSRWDVEGQHLGVRYFIRTKPTTKKHEAQAIERAEHERIAQEQSGRKPEVLLKDVIQQWLLTKPHKTHSNLVNKANQWGPFVRDRPLSEVQDVARLAVAAWASAGKPTSRDGRRRSVEPLSTATINRRLAVLKGALTWSGHEDLSRKIKLRREQNTKEVYLTRADVLQLAKCATTQECRAAIMIAAYSGLRASELLSLPGAPSQQDTLAVPTSKNGRPRVVPTPPRISRYLRALPLGMSYDQLYKGFLAARKAAELGPEVTFHTLRHTYASWMINAGVDLLTLSKLMGHSSVAVTQRYAHLYDKTLRDAVRKLK